MIASARRRSFSFREYLELEEASNTKHEYAGGEIYAMAGGTPAHAALSMAVGASLVAKLRGGPCRVYSSDLRVRVMETGLATYPDVTVICGPLAHDPESNATVTNPTVLVEILSPSTADYDRGEKLDHYRQLPSLRACLFVDPDRRSVLVVRRAGDHWATDAYGPGDAIALDFLGTALDIDALYEDAGLP